MSRTSGDGTAALRKMGDLIRIVEMLSDVPAFELLERFRLYPQTRNIPFFVLLRDGMKEGERAAVNSSVDHLVRKSWLSREEFLSYFKKAPRD